MADHAAVAGQPRASDPGVAARSSPRRYYLRFERVDRVMHALLMVSFIGCALTGLPLLLSDQAWAAGLARVLGGFVAAQIIHRVCATVMIVVFVAPTFCTQTQRWSSAGKSRVGCVGIMLGFEVINNLCPNRTRLKSSRPSARDPVTAPIQAARSVAFTNQY